MTEHTGEEVAPRESPLLEAMLGEGGVSGTYHGGRIVRHFGDPAGEYAAATIGVAIVDRSHRARLAVSGREPRKMLDGILTGTLPAAPASAGGVAVGRATYHAVLTPKGRMITDLWALLPDDEEDPGFVLDIPVAGARPLAAHLAKVLPPRFARVSDLSSEMAAMTLVGPEAAALLSREALGLRVEGPTLSAGAEGSWWRAGGWPGAPTVVRSGEVEPEAFDLYAPSAAVTQLWRRLVHAGAVPAGAGVLATLRVEAGRPVFGTDMDDGTIPVEAGIHQRAIDYAKGCYTGQEVIVRIRDRGHVNRHLRRLRLGEVPTPRAGTELLAADGSEKAVGRITSAVVSPRYGGVVALAYVRRGVERVLLDGREVEVQEL